MRGPLPIDNDDARLGMHLREGVSGTQPGDAGADDQPICLLPTTQWIASR